MHKCEESACACAVECVRVGGALKAMPTATNEKKLNPDPFVSDKSV